MAVLVTTALCTEFPQKYNNFVFFFAIFEQISQTSGNTWGETCVLAGFGQHVACGSPWHSLKLSVASWGSLELSGALGESARAPSLLGGSLDVPLGRSKAPKGCRNIAGDARRLTFLSVLPVPSSSRFPEWPFRAGRPSVFEK